MGTHNHNPTHNFTERFEFSGKAKTWSLIAIVIGILSILYGFLLDPSEHHSERVFANLLLMSYYFTCVCAAGLFFLALQYVAQAGWSAGLLRVPQAFAKILPIASLILVIVCASGLFTHNLYHHWNHEGITDPKSEHYDALIAAKASYLNVPFFLTRLVIFLGAYSFFAWLFAKYSEREDLQGGLVNYDKSIKWSAVFLIVFGFTTPIWAFDTIMSL